jgi:hypothetical protein
VISLDTTVFILHNAVPRSPEVIMRNDAPRPLPAAFASVLAAAILSSPAPAQTARWINPSGGGFATPSNWDVGHPPAQTDTASFGPGAAYTVTLNADTTVTNLAVDTGSPTVDLGGHQLHIGVGTGPGVVTLAPTGTGTISVTLRNGTMTLPVLPFNSGMFIGGGGGSTTNVTIGPNASITSPYCSINIGGAGVANVTLSGTIYLANGAYPDGAVIVNAGSTLLVTSGTLSPNHLRNFGGRVTMAGGTGNVTTTINTGDFTLSGGAHLTSGGGMMCSGHLAISGGASLATYGLTDLTGSDTILDGGTFGSGGGDFGAQGSPTSLVLRNGGAINWPTAGFSFSGNPHVSVGPGCTVNTSVVMQGGLLHVDQGANMTLGVLTVGSPVTLEVAIDGANLPAAPMITCNPSSTVAATLAGTLAVIPDHPNNLHIGDQVEVIRVGAGHTIQGSFAALNAPTIGGGRQFQIIQTTQSVLVRVVSGGSPCWNADFDGDGDVGTDADIQAFFACLAGNCCTTCASPDFDGDGDTGTTADIEAFFRILAGGPC